MTEGGEKKNGTVMLRGAIDSGNADRWLEKILAQAQETGGLPELDAGELTYISSAGLRMLLLVQKQLGRRLTLRNVSPEIHETFDITGFTTLMDVKRKMRQISTEGCPVIGKGAFGTVFRLDEDTVVKVYNRADDLPLIENEQKRAKQAFLRGIPTAIPFDIVRVGDRYGSVFEMVKAGNCNDLLAASPQSLEDILRLYVPFLRSVHAVEAGEDEFSDQREFFLKQLMELGEVLPRRVRDRLKALLEAMPLDRHLVHGDIHLKNVMLSGGEMMLIDMESLGAGDPVFEFGGLFTVYIAFNEDEPGNSLLFLGMERGLAEGVFYGALKSYLDFPEERALNRALDRVSVPGYLKFLHLLVFKGAGKAELREKRIRRAVERLEALSLRVDALCLRD